MIRTFEQRDMEAVLDIWLRATLKAHDFIEASFWQSQVDNMRHLYLPASQSYVIEQDARVLGFYSLHEDRLAALFVAPECQGQGLGKRLLAHARTLRSVLNLGVYKNNTASCAFYRAQGFVVIREQTDEQTGQREYLMRSVAP